MSLAFSRWSRTALVALAATILVTATSAGRASAQSVFVRKIQEIYDGAPSEQAGIKLGSWGSGVCEESTSNTIAGSRSLKITPKDLYSGGRVDFGTPLDLTASFKNPEAYLQLVCQFWGAQSADGLTQALGTAAARTDIYGNTLPQPKQIKTVRVVLYMENGPAMEMQAPVSAYKISDDGWMTVSFPISVMKGRTELAQYRVTRIVIAGDGTEPFHVGEIRTVPDATGIVADAGESMEVSKNYPIAFQGFAQSGASAVKYSWDFDAKNGIQEEAAGDLVYHRFTQTGTYDITFTVADLFGVKKPASKKITVKVNE